jgi:hypothetical protein
VRSFGGFAANLTTTWSESDLAPEMIGPAVALFGDASGAASTIAIAAPASKAGAAHNPTLLRILGSSPGRAPT